MKKKRRIGKRYEKQHGFDYSEKAAAEGRLSGLFDWQEVKRDYHTKKGDLKGRGA